MYVIYFDEVKYDPPTQKSFWLGGLMTKLEAVPQIESEINALAMEQFGSSDPATATEFHAKNIFHGNSNYTGIQIEKRLEVLNQLSDIIMNHEAEGDLERVAVRIIPENIVMTGDSPEEIGFMYFVEQVDKFLKEKSSTGLLIGDYDKPTVNRSIYDLSKFKATSTAYSRGRKIECIADCVHYAQSHHSRLIQLAYIFVWSCQLGWNPHNDKWPRKRYQEMLNERKLHYPKWSRHWPTEATWYR
jgi:hypothetical protein